MEATVRREARASLEMGLLGCNDIKVQRPSIIVGKYLIAKSEEISLSPTIA